MKHTAFIFLGSNMGNRFILLGEALTSLQKQYPIEVVNVSSIYETEPVGYEDQDVFLNMVAQIRTSLAAEELLDACLQIEKELGRKRDIRWGPRTIDLDILLYNDQNMTTEKLIVPHPRMLERSFVMIPLLEICPDITFSNMKKPHGASCSELPKSEG